MQKDKITYKKVVELLMNSQISYLTRPEFKEICDSLDAHTTEEIDLIIYYVMMHLHLKLTTYKVEMIL